jgi:hypothetical protein
VWSIFIGRKTPTPSSISNTGLIDGVPLSTLMGFTTFVAHHDFYTIMDQIHLSSLVDQIQLALRHICNTCRRGTPLPHRSVWCLHCRCLRAPPPGGNNTEQRIRGRKPVNADRAQVRPKRTFVSKIIYHLLGCFNIHTRNLKRECWSNSRIED